MDNNMTAPVNDPEEKRPKARHRVLKIVLVVILIIALLIGGGFLINLVKVRVEKSKHMDDIVLSEDPGAEAEKELLSRMRKEQSDIKGMTKFEKYKKGLNPADGSDTDGDGLTDKEEIEKYGTDPLKMSTSGDMYTDGEKVAKGLSLTKKNPYRGTIKYEGNDSDGTIKLKADDAYGRFATVTDITGLDSLNGKTIYREYAIEHFSGMLSVNPKKIKEADGEDVSIYLKDSGKTNASASRTEEDGDFLKLKKPLEGGHVYTLFVVKKSIISVPASTTYGDALPEFGSEGFDGIVYSCPILDFVSGDASIEYLASSDKKVERQEKEALLALSNGDDLIGAQTDENSKKIKAVSKSEIERKYAFFKTIFPFGNIKKNGDSPATLLFSYARLEDAEKLLNDDEKSYLSRDVVNSGFSVNKDAFIFPNFGTEVSKGGVCAGISTYLASVYNAGGPQKTSGEVQTQDGTSYKWDISSASFKNLKTKHKIHSYQNEDYVSDHKDKNGVLTKNMDKDDTSFANMLSEYWARANNAEKKSVKENVLYYNDGKGTSLYSFADKGYSYSTIEWMKKQIKAGRVVSVGMTVGADFSDKEYNTTDKGHMVTLYGYESMDNGKTIFKVYDSNFPGRSDLTMTVIKRKISLSGKKYTTFFYSYQPLKDKKHAKNYVFTNLKNGKYRMSVIDENGFKDMIEVN